MLSAHHGRMGDVTEVQVFALLIVRFLIMAMISASICSIFLSRSASSTRNWLSRRLSNTIHPPTMRIVRGTVMAKYTHNSLEMTGSASTLAVSKQEIF